MKFTIKHFLIIFLTLLLSACSTIKVETDFDEDVDFSTLNTFTLIHKDSNGSNTLTNDRIAHALTQALNEKGYHNVPKIGRAHV